jgi:regulator of protease activity HflC (stomatin/prohibitin superfamily)
MVGFGLAVHGHHFKGDTTMSDAMRRGFEPSGRVKLFAVLGLFLSAVCVVLFFVLFEVERIEGNEMGVHETWGKGVLEDPMPPKTYFFFPGFMHTIYKYDMSSQVYVMNDRKGTEEFGQGRESDTYTVQSKEGQDLTFSLNVRWRLDPQKLILLHKTIRDDFEEKVLRPVLLREVKDAATIREAIVAYSGEGLVALQSTIEGRLTNPEGEIRRQGIIVENFVIERITLDPEYRDQIKARQVAVQRELRAKQETLAALEEANKAEAEARADFKRTVVEAERDKEVGILLAQQQAEQEVLAAEAAKKKEVLAAEAERDSGELRAQAILAIGAAEADAQKLRLQAYAVDGADNFVRVEIAKSIAQANQGIQGYIPESMTINVITDRIMTAIERVVGANATTVAER